MLIGIGFGIAAVVFLLVDDAVIAIAIGAGCYAFAKKDRQGADPVAPIGTTATNGRHNAMAAAEEYLMTKRRARAEPPDETIGSEVLADRPPLPLRCALRSLGKCVLRTGVLLSRRAKSKPKDRLGQVLRFGDGSGGRIYRETVIDDAAVDSPVVLVVAFRLRWVRGSGHALFRVESLLNTPLFVGFPGFVSKLWLADDENGVYRGFYQWNGSQLADAYVRALWWVLALVSVRSSIHYAVLPGLRRDDVLADPTVLDHTAPCRRQAWWRLTVVEQPRP